jgi:hypothetical protein
MLGSMAQETQTNSREERLAAKLRENLRRRKAQGKARTANAESATGATLPKSGEDG